MAGSQNNTVLQNRRALEALRSGVPSGDAIATLGCSQPDIEREFNSLLSRLSNEGDAQKSSLGMLASGGFGSGKSHLLGYLKTQALAQNFVCSRVVISKETPLFDIDKVFKAAVETAEAPGVTGQIVEEAALHLDFNSERYATFFKWANQKDTALHTIFPATLAVFEKYQESELLNEIIWFWSGEKIAVQRVRDGLKKVGLTRSYPFRSPLVRDLPPQRLRFVLELFKAAGYRGWVVLMDEIELVANYSVLQRARSYAELTRWMGQADGEEYPGLVLVGTQTADFASVVLDEKEDRHKAVPLLKGKQRNEGDAAATKAETGMRLIERVHPLAEPDDEMLGNLYNHLREIHSHAYRWTAPDIDHGLSRGERRVFRRFVRRWINEWDLRRLYPGVDPDIEETEFTTTYVEDPDLEQETKNDSTSGDGTG